MKNDTRWHHFQPTPRAIRQPPIIPSPQTIFSAWWTWFGVEQLFFALTSDIASTHDIYRTASGQLTRKILNRNKKKTFRIFRSDGEDFLFNADSSGKSFLLLPASTDIRCSDACFAYSARSQSIFNRMTNIYTWSCRSFYCKRVIRCAKDKRRSRKSLRAICHKFYRLSMRE